MPKGGKQPGAGRPKGVLNPETIDKALLREELRRYVAPHIAAMTAAQIKNAQGLNYLVARNKQSGKFEKLTEEQFDAIIASGDDAHLSIEVWQKDPSVQAYTDLMNRVIDKPIEPVEVTGAGGGPIQLSERLASARRRTK